MNQKLKDFAVEIERLITESGTRMGTKKAMQLEACMIAGYIYGAKSENTDAINPYLHLLLMGGRQLTTEAKKET